MEDLKIFLEVGVLNRVIKHAGSWLGGHKKSIRFGRGACLSSSGLETFPVLITE